jgi:hypothetical protein
MMTTPVGPRRSKRISMSPRNPKFKRPRPSDPYPQSLTTVSKEPQLESLAQLELEFPYSYWDDEKKQFSILNHEESVQLLNVLREHFDGVLSILPVAPFLIIECDKAIPDPSTTPFLVAGLIACFVIQGEPYPFGIDFIGRDGGAFGLREEDIPPSVWKDLKPFNIPQLSTFQWMYDYFSPLATHISSFPQQIVVELNEMNDEQYESLLSTLPDAFGCLNIGYRNGTILTKKLARTVQPQPRELGGQYDDTDYLDPENGGILNPGMLLECGGYVDKNNFRQGIVMSNSGIKVENVGGDERMTVAVHGWDAVDEKIVYHPTRRGHNVGTILDVLGEDIGLTSLTCNFSNVFPDLQVRAKSLLHSSQLRYNQFVAIDSCFTGVQTLRVLGVRTGVDRRETVTEGGAPVPGPSRDHRYIKIAQGIYGINSALIPREPQTRDGVCGTPLVVAGRLKGEMARVLNDGMVAGFMLWNDIEGRYNMDRQIYCFCQVTDPLIDAGWFVSDT